VNERYEQATHDVNELFVGKPRAPKKLTFYEALARCVKYNLDYRIKLVNTALQAGQLKIATFTMFPAINASGSYYSRNNDFSSFGITSAGQPTDVLNSTPRTVRSARMGLSWNIIEFGVGYVRAKQQGERILVADEEARKQLQQLTQDVLVAYWSAYSAQQLMAQTKEFQILLNQAKNLLTSALEDTSVPKENLLNYQGALLEGNRRLIQLQYKYDKAMADLRHLLYLPLDQKFVLAPPPQAFRNIQNLRSVNLQKLDAVTLVNRPELRGQNYQTRIAKFGLKTVIIQALPGITINKGWNYNSNEFLVNREWLDRSLDIAWNLLNLASLPATYETAEVQLKYEQLKLMALTMGVLTETRYAFAHYQTLHNEYVVAHKQTRNAHDLYMLNKNRQLASLASTEQVILAKLHNITTQMDENLLLSDLSTALGELYISVGLDMLPPSIISAPLPDAIQILTNNFTSQDIMNFNHFINTTYHQLFDKQTAKDHQSHQNYILMALT
jgi:outer membrane protein TolC